KDVLALDDLVHSERARELKEMADSVLKDQKRLASLLDEYRRTGDPALLAEMNRLMDRMSQKLEALNQKLAALNPAAAEEFLNLDALRRQLGPDGQKSLAALRKELNGGDIDAASRRADE